MKFTKAEEKSGNNTNVGSTDIKRSPCPFEGYTGYYHQGLPIELLGIGVELITIKVVTIVAYHFRYREKRR